MYHVCRSLNHCLPLLAMFPCGVACRFVCWLACVFVCGGLCDLPCLLFRCVSWYFVTVGLVCFARPARAIFYLSVGVFSFDLFAFEHFRFPRFHFSVHLVCVH